MKLSNLLLGIALVAVTSVSVFNTTHATSSPATAPVCTVKRITGSGTTGNGNSYSLTATTATSHFKVSGATGCKVDMTMVSWTAPSITGEPWLEQKIYKVVHSTFSAGNQSMTIALPPNNCFYQIDTVTGTSPYGSDYSHLYGARAVAGVHGGTKKCEETPSTPTTPETPQTPVTPIVENTPETPALEAAPEAAVLPQTGITSTIVSVLGIGALAASTFAWIQSRRTA